MRRREGGQASLELVALLPLLVLVALISVQVGIVAWTFEQASSAARAGARAASLCQDAQVSAHNAPSPWLRSRVNVEDLSGPDEGRVRVNVTVPVLFTGARLPGITATRSATFPRTGC